MSASKWQHKPLRSEPNAALKKLMYDNMKDAYENSDAPDQLRAVLLSLLDGSQSRTLRSCDNMMGHRDKINEVGSSMRPIVLLC